MKALQALAAVSFVLFLLVPAAGAADLSSPVTLASVGCSVDDGLALPAFMLPVEVSWGGGLPSCFALEGTYCPTPGRPGVRCLWQTYEPGICFCQPNHTYTCG